LDTLLTNGTGILKDATEVNFLNETTESQLVVLKNVKLVDLASWTKNPLGFTISVTDGNVTHDVRIDNDINLVNMDAPSGFFDLTGIGSQLMHLLHLILVIKGMQMISILIILLAMYTLKQQLTKLAISTI
jgi:hypothetical protein